MLYLRLYHAYIYLIIEYLGYDLGCVGDIQLYVGLGIFRQLPRQIAGCQVIAYGKAGADLEMSHVLVRFQCPLKGLAVVQ